MKDLPYTFEKENNRIVIDMPKAWYDGDPKTIICVQNDIEAKIFIRCRAQPPSVPFEQFEAFLLYDVGMSAALVWSDRFNRWFIKGSGCQIVTKNEFHVYDNEY